MNQADAAMRKSIQEVQWPKTSCTGHKRFWLSEGVPPLHPGFVSVCAVKNIEATTVRPGL